MRSPSTVMVTVRPRGMSQWISVQTAWAMVRSWASSPGQDGVAGAVTRA